MKVADALQGVTRLFLDTAPIIYYVEQHPRYFVVVQSIFEHIDAGTQVGVTSPVTLAECLVAPYRLGLARLQQDFFELVVYGRNTVFAPIDSHCAQVTADLRARYHLLLPDAFQIAVALLSGCEAFLTNDAALQRVHEMRVLVLDELV